VGQNGFFADGIMRVTAVFLGNLLLNSDIFEGGLKSFLYRNNVKPIANTL